MKLKQWLTSYQICFWFGPDSAFCEGWGEELGVQGEEKGEEEEKEENRESKR